MALDLANVLIQAIANHKKNLDARICRNFGTRSLLTEDGILKQSADATGHIIRDSAIQPDRRYHGSEISITVE